MKAVLLSIKPQYCELIASGSKKVEIRKTRPKLNTPFKCYIYQTKHKWVYSIFRSAGFKTLPNMLENALGKIIGEFICDSIDEYRADFCESNAIFKITPHKRKDDVDIVCIASDEESNPNDCELCKSGCVSFNEIKQYIGTKEPDNKLYAWHISDFVIYDKPKELGEFTKYNRSDCEFEHLPFVRPDNCNQCVGCKLEKPPWSWCCVEEL